MFRAKDIMKGRVVAVKRDTPVYDAVRIMVEKNITGLPVVNDDMTLVGLISEKDVLSLLYDVEAHAGKVEDFMTKGVVCFNEEDSLVDIAECLIENSFRRVPILSHGKVVGIISRKDLIAYIMKIRHQDAKYIAAHSG